MGGGEKRDSGSLTGGVECDESERERRSYEECAGDGGTPANLYVPNTNKLKQACALQQVVVSIDVPSQVSCRNMK